MQTFQKTFLGRQKKSRTRFYVRTMTSHLTDEDYTTGNLQNIKLLVFNISLICSCWLLSAQVMLQTQQEGKVSALKLAVTISKEQGVGALYNGLSASLCRQLTYSTVRFGIYEVLSLNLIECLVFPFDCLFLFVINLFKKSFTKF